MYMALRIFRGYIGYQFGFAVVGFINLLVVITARGLAGTEEWIAVGLTLGWIALLYGGFFGMWKLINWLHRRNHGVPHPTLAKGPWML